MRILAVDIGTGTQDIYLYNSNLDMENNIKLVVPSPTMIIHRRIKQATKQGVPILLDGVTMGGGPSAWAAEAHLRAGFNVFATPQAARTFNDDLEAVKAMGIEVLSEDEATRLPGSVQRIKLQDFDFSSIVTAVQAFEIDLTDLAAIAVGVFDHGNAPANISDRKFRFDYLDERIRQLNRLSAFAYRSNEVPLSLTRMQAVVSAAKGIDLPLVVMDTAPAAVLGARFDPVVTHKPRNMIVNVGNFHTLAFRIGPSGIEGLFEHHTGFLNLDKLERLLIALAEGRITNDEVFGDQGHGALVYDPIPLTFGQGDYDVVVTGPRRGIFPAGELKRKKQGLRPYFPAPFGDMMITGCFGLLAATAEVMPELAEPIHGSLYGSDKPGAAPWDVD